MKPPSDLGLKNIKKHFDLEIEMINYFGEEKTKKVLSDIAEYYKTLLPLQPESIAFAGMNKFNRKGDLITDFNINDVLFNYLITFRKRTNNKGVEVDQTFFYAFN